MPVLMSRTFWLGLLVAIPLLFFIEACAGSEASRSTRFLSHDPRGDLKYPHERFIGMIAWFFTFLASGICFGSLFSSWVQRKYLSDGENPTWEKRSRFGFCCCCIICLAWGAYAWFDVHSETPPSPTCTADAFKPSYREPGRACGNIETCAGAAKMSFLTSDEEECTAVVCTGKASRRSSAGDR